MYSILDKLVWFSVLIFLERSPGVSYFLTSLKLVSYEKFLVESVYCGTQACLHCLYLILMAAVSLAL